MVDSLEQACSQGSEVNLDAVRMFLWEGFVGGDETLVRNVRCLPGDAVFEYEGGELTLRERRWYELDAPPIDASLDELLSRAHTALLRAIESELRRGGSGHCVGLSSGLDSRLILGGLLEHLPASEITAYTFGVEGTWDYAHGPEVARAAGVRHQLFDRSDYTWSPDLLRRIARETDGNVPILHHNPLLSIVDRLDGEIHWHGFMGDRMSGAHLPPADVDDPAQWFLSHNADVPRRFATRMAPELPWHLPLERGPGDLSAFRVAQALDLYNRQERYIGHIAFLRSLEFRAPLTDSEWSSVMLAIPEQYRRGQLLHRELLARYYPDLARVPTSALNGRAILGDARSHIRPIPRPWHLARMAANVVGVPAPHNPYIAVNMREWLRKRPDLRSTAEEFIDAAARRPFLDGDAGSPAVAQLLEAP